MELPDASKSQGLGQSLDLISIPQLSPDFEDSEKYSFRAVVTLVWPFSSSSRSFSLLLAEPDFRLRNQNGQVKVTFCGFCAEEVARAKIGIGDTVILSLQGAQWTKNQNIQSTPGRSLMWELQFKNRVKLEATRNGAKIAGFDINRPPSPKKDVLITEPTTPAPSAGGHVTQNLSQGNWETPIFLPMKRVFSSSTLRSDFNLFEDEDGYIPGLGRKRPRFSFPSSGWRLVDEPDDSSKELIGNDDNWFESDEEILGRDEEGKEETHRNTAAELEDESELPDGTTPMQNVLGDDVQLLESEVQMGEGEGIRESSDAIQVIELSEEKTIDSSLRKTQLSPSTRRLDSLAPSDIPKSPPLVSIAAESLDNFHELSSDRLSSQSQLSNSTYTNIPINNERSIITSNMFNIGSPEGAEVDGTDLLHNNHESHEFLEQSHTAEVSANYHDNTISSENSLERFAEMANEAFKRQQNIYEKVSEDDKLDDIEEAEQDEVSSDINPTGNDLIERRNGNFGLNSETEEAITGGPKYSEPEDMIDDVNSIDSGIIEAEDLDHDHHESEIEEAEYESDLEGRYLSDDAGDDDDVMSDQSENQVEFGAERDDEAYAESSESEIPQRTVYPEVIVIDSDSEDEPRIPNTRPPLQESDTFNSSHELSDIEQDNHQYMDHMEEVKDEYSEEDQKAEYILQDEADLYEDEGHNGKDLPIHDAYISDEAARSVDFYALDHNKRHDTYTSDKEKNFIEQNNVQSSDHLSEAKQSDDHTHLSMARNHLTPDVPDNISRFDNEHGTPRKQRQSSLFDLKEIPHNDNDIGQSPISAGIFHGQGHFPDATRRIQQRLAYRTVSPMPVPTPPSTINDEHQSQQSKPVVDHHDSLRYSPEIIELDPVDDKRSHRWTDGSDEESPQAFDQQLSTEKGYPHNITEQDDSTTEKLDEVVLLEHQMVESRKTDQLDKLSASNLSTLDSKIHPTLATLSGLLNKTIDVISVVVDTLSAEHAESIPEKHQIKLRVTDISMAGTTLDVDIVKSTETSLPTVMEGDVILLRNFEVQTLDSSIILIGSDDCGWVVFSPTSNEPQVSHPAASFGEPEQEYVKKLQNWYREDGAAMAAGHMLQISISQEERLPSPFSTTSSDAGSVDSSKSGPAVQPHPRQRERQRRVTIHELRGGRRYTEIGFFGSDSIHELRDGTVYAHPFARDD